MIASADTASSFPRLLAGRVHRGCNVHHRATVYVQRVFLGKLAELRTSDAGPRFGSTFLDRFTSLTGAPLPPSLAAELTAGDGIPFDRALLEAILAIEGFAARAMRRPDTIEVAGIVPDPASPGEVDLVWACQSGTVSRGAVKSALAGVLELLPVSLCDLRAPPRERFSVLVRKLERRCRRRQWSPATAALATAAKERGLACETLAGDYLRLGEGVHQQVVSAATTPNVASVFPDGVAAGIPVALIVGTRSAGSTARELDGILRASGRSIGLAARRVTTVAGEPVDPTSYGPGDGARFLLGDARVEMVVSTVSPRRVVERGLRLEHVTVTAVLDAGSEDARDVAHRGIGVGVRATTGSVVVDARDPLAETLAREVGSERLTLVSPGRPGSRIARHLAANGSAVLRTKTGRVETLELRRAGETIAAVRVSSLRSSTEPVGPRRTRRAMFAIALAHGLGLTGAEIATAVEKRRFLRR